MILILRLCSVTVPLTPHTSLRLRWNIKGRKSEFLGLLALLEAALACYRDNKDTDTPSVTETGEICFV